MIDRCDHCPVPAGLVCISQATGHLRFCDWAALGGGHLAYVLDHAAPAVDWEAAAGGNGCPAIPDVLRLAASGPCVAGDFPPAALARGPTPAGLAGLDLGANCHLSTREFPDEAEGRPFRFHVAFSDVFVRLSRVYLGPKPSREAPIYTWKIGQPGNRCSPFAMTSGVIYPGGNPACDVTLTA